MRLDAAGSRGPRSTEGRTAAESGIVFGHENMGIVEEVGSGVASVKKGDRVVMPFNVACGFCKNCLNNKTGFCLTVNPGFAGGAYAGYSTPCLRRSRT